MENLVVQIEPNIKLRSKSGTIDLIELSNRHALRILLVDVTHSGQMRSLGVFSQPLFGSRQSH
jgi:hypothetical protein